MTYQLRMQTLTPDLADEYERMIYLRPGEQIKPRSRGTAGLMNAFGMAR